MTTYWLKFELLSDAALGRGDGLAGVVNAEVQHDEYGLPYLSGKTLKGLLGAECAEILFALERTPAQKTSWQDAARFLFGEPGSGAVEGGCLHIGDARLPHALRGAIAQEFVRLESIPDPDQRQREAAKLQRAMLDSLTALRRQTAMDASTGAPKENTLRTIRVILRKTPFEAELIFLEPPDDLRRGLLAACVRAFRRVGTSRNRGLGQLKADLYEVYPGKDVKPVTEVWFDFFRKAVQ
jgi:CRISPR/Cas system CSM-associated protein Csm3 (group 7 of RAMP superfamily)